MNNNSITQARITGVAGLCQAAGTTQLVTMLANYYASGLHRRTAVVACMDYSCFCYAGSNFNKKFNSNFYRKSNNDSNPLTGKNLWHGNIKNADKWGNSLYGVDFYNGRVENILDIIKEHYDEIILDIKCDKNISSSETMGLLHKCNNKILVLSMLPWKAEECLKRMERIKEDSYMGRCQAVSLTNDDNFKKIIKEKYKMTIKYIPWNINPWIIEGKNIKWLSEIAA